MNNENNQNELLPTPERQAEIFWDCYETSNFGAKGGYSPKDFAEMTRYEGVATDVELARIRILREGVVINGRRQQPEPVAGECPHCGEQFMQDIPKKCPSCQTKCC